MDEYDKPILDNHKSFENYWSATGTPGFLVKLLQKQRFFLPKLSKIKAGEDLIHRLHERCGKSEEVQAVMKDDLAGGKLPSADFGENEAWYWIMILALNLNVMMKSLALAPAMETTLMKKIRF